MSHQAGLGAVNQFAAYLNINHFGDQSLGNGVDVDTAPATTAATKAAPDGIDTAELAHHARLAAQNQDNHVGAGAPPLSGSRFAASSPARTASYKMAGTTLDDLDRALGNTPDRAQLDHSARLRAIQHQFEYVVLAHGKTDPSDLGNIDLERTRELKGKLAGPYGALIRTAVDNGQYNTKIGEDRVVLTVVAAHLVGVKKEAPVKIEGVDIFSGLPLEACSGHLDIIELYDSLTAEQQILVAYIVMTDTDYRIHPSDSERSNNTKLDAIEALLKAIKSNSLLPRNVRGKSDELKQALGSEDGAVLQARLDYFMQNGKEPAPLPSAASYAPVYTNPNPAEDKYYLAARYWQTNNSALRNLLLSMFSPDELKSFLTYSDIEALMGIAYNVNFKAAPSTVADDVTDSLKRNGLINADLIHALIVARPRRKKEILRD